MSTELSLNETQKEWHGSYKSYLIGFFASLFLTLASFHLVIDQPITGYWLVIAVMGLAITQAIMQLIFFLHLGQEAKPRWETMIFFFMVTILLIIALGTLWIMNDLEHRMMPEMDHKAMGHHHHD